MHIKYIFTYIELINKKKNKLAKLERKNKIRKCLNIKKERKSREIL